MNRLVYNIKEIMELLGISRLTCYRLIKSGQLRAIQIGNRWKVPKQALEDFLSAKEEQTDIKTHTKK
jgi:excisionase family DNA binding protein